MVANIPGADATPAGRDRLAELIEKSGAENFPVASRILPRALRRDLLAVYGFARMVDDAGDEDAAIDEAERLNMLDGVSAELDRIWTGEPEWPVMRRLAETVRAHDIPPEPFRKLIEANRIDQRVARYASMADLAEYCEYSANPVGAIVLYIGDRATPERLAWSDRVCTALQILEHTQDVGEDYRRGRVYVPREVLAAAGVTDDVLDAELQATHTSPRLRVALRGMVDHARSLLDDGVPLVGTLRGFIRWAVAGYVAGGIATAYAIEHAEYDVLRTTPRPSRRRTLAVTLRLAAGRGPARGGRR